MDDEGLWNSEHEVSSFAGFRSCDDDARRKSSEVVQQCIESTCIVSLKEKVLVELSLVQLALR